MKSLRTDKILMYNEDTLAIVRKTVDMDKPGVMEGAVDILAGWVKEQNHFTKKNFDRRYLETIIIASKGSIERAKSRLDKACTFRSLKPELFCYYDIRHFFNTELKHVSHGFLPKMTKNHERVYMYRDVGVKYEPTAVKNFVRMAPYFAEYMRLNDYATSYYVVMDYRDANLADLVTKLRISDIQEIVTYAVDCYGFRLKAFYFISSSKLVEVGVAIFKQVLSSKLASRVIVLNDRESVKNYIQADILPKEYGGNEISLEELHEKWLDVLTSEDYTKYLREINLARTDEALRQKGTVNDQYLGLPGTFRMLSVD